MTREEASNILDDFDVNFEGHTAEEVAEAFDVAFRALEQEPCEDWHDVPSDEMTLEQARQAVKDLRKKLAEYLEQEPIIDKIRAEIEQLRLHKAEFLTNDNKVCIDSQAVLNIIDKYKVEVEPQESEEKQEQTIDEKVIDVIDFAIKATDS